MLLYPFIIFVSGLIVGSFLNCLIYRLETGESCLKGRSFCPKCRHILEWQDLIPLLSYVFLRGKCRYCREKISLQYPLVELATGLLFLSIFAFNTGGFLELLFTLIISCFFVVVFVYDLRHFLILDKVIFPAVFLCVLWIIFSGSDWMNYLLASLFGAGFFLFFVLISKGKWMGVGDVKLGLLMGLFLGWPKVLLAVFIAFLVGAVIGLWLVVFKKESMKSEIPFGPFLILGTFISLFFGEILLNWYLGLFLIK